MLKEGWRDVFADRRTHRRAIEHALAWPAAMGDRTISQSICILGRSQQDWNALRLVEDFRQLLDQKGAADRSLLVPVDGSFCNQTFFKTPIPKVDMLARCRKDARLCFPAPAESRRKYAAEVFTPEDVRKSNRLDWKQTRIYFGSKCRRVRYKVLDNVLWRRGAATRLLRLIVIAPVPHKMSPHSRTNYREPAYLLATDLQTSPKKLLQHYLDRWQIEVNHRDA